MSQLILIALSWYATNVPLVSPDPKSLIVSDADYLRSEEFVLQLGSVLYSERASATQQLRDMGRLALPTLEIARLNDNPEVRQRVKLILPSARQADFQAKLNIFLADKQGKYEHQLPGWDRFQAITGKSEAGRRLFTEILKSPLNRELVQAVAMNSEELGQRVLRRQIDLYKSAVPGIVRSQPYQPTLIDALGLIFAEAVAGEAAMPANPVGVPGMRGYSLLSRPNIHNEVQEESFAEPARKLILAWCDSRTLSAGIYQAMCLTEQLNWPESRKYAIKVLSDPVVPSYLISKAASNLGRFGTKADARYLRHFLDDRTILRPASNTLKEIQVRDIVLTMMILMSKRNLDDFNIKTRNPSMTTLLYSNYNFDSVEDRDNAFAKWNKLEPGLAVRPKK